MANLIGMVVDQVTFPVEPGKVREFALAAHTRDPAHLDREHAQAEGFPRIPATATHVVVAGHYRNQSAFVAALGLDIRRIVVGEVSWEYARPVLAGDVLTGIRRVIGDQVRASRSGQSLRSITLSTPYTNSDGELVVTQNEVLIERGVAS